MYYENTVANILDDGDRHAGFNLFLQNGPPIVISKRMEVVKTIKLNSE